MLYYCARLLVVCLVESRKPQKRNLYDYPFVVFRAANYSRAFKVALKLGKEQETRYELNIRQASDEQAAKVWKAAFKALFIVIS